MGTGSHEAELIDDMDQKPFNLVNVRLKMG